MSMMPAWISSLSVPAMPVLQCWHDALPASDQQQARQRQGAHWSGFVASRYLLRHLLSKYVNPQRAPSDWLLLRQGQRPLLAEANGWHFSLSHTHSRVACLLTRSAVCGIDLENTARPAACLAIARRYFAPEEYQWLSTLPAEEQRHLFFSLWTRKEACLKAWQRGIAGHLAQIRFEDGILAPSQWPAELSHLPVHLWQATGTDWMLSAAVHADQSVDWQHVPLHL